MIDVVYPLRLSGSRMQDLELKFSLRSVQAHVRLELGRLFIVGYAPFWTKDLTVIAARDRGDKALNLLAKYHLMLEADVSDPFLLLDDDHIFFEDRTDIPVHTKGDLSALATEYRGNTHGKYLTNCLEFLRALGLPTKNYQIHYPMLVAKSVLARALEIAGTVPTVMGSLYGNLVDGETLEVTRDFKVNRPADFDALRGGPFMSVADGMIRNQHLRSMLNERLPEKSRWER